MPALLIALALMAMNYWLAVRRGFPTEKRVPPRELLGLFRAAVLPLLTPVILLAGIYTGAMTPTEAAAAAAFYATVISVLVYRTMGFAGFRDVLVESAQKSAVVVLIIAGAFLFSSVIAIERLPNALAAWVDSWDMAPLAFFLLINVVFLVLGMLLPAATILLVIVPVVVPAALALGIDPIHFGVVIVINTMIGLITPPYGVLIFVVSAVNRIDAWAIIREIVPFIAVLVASLLLLVLVPDLVMFLPHQFGY